MKNKIILLIMLVVLSSFVYAQAVTCEGYSHEGECYGTFDSFFEADPITAATNNPDEYMTLIYGNSDLVSENPEAYEAVIAQGVEYVNQNTFAFEKYMEFQEINFYAYGELNSFDTESGRFETRGPSGETVSIFNLDDLKFIMEDESGSVRFTVEEDGRLTYGKRYQIQKDDGVMLHSIRDVSLQGELKEIDGELYLTNGRFSDEYSNLNIEITGENTAKLTSKCLGADPPCGFIEVEVVDNIPIALPSGTLEKGKVTLMDPSFFDLALDSIFVNKDGASFEVTQRTRITEEDNGCQQIDHSCVYYNEKDIIIKTVDGNQIKVDMKDGTYQNIIIRQMTDENQYVEVGEFDGKIITVDQSGRLFHDGIDLVAYSNGEELEAQIISSLEYTEAYEIAKKKTSRVELTLEKKGNKKVKIEFTRDEPITQGRLNGLQSNIATVFRSDYRQYPWLVYEGKPTTNIVGKTRTDFIEKIAELGTEQSEEQVRLLFQAKAIEGPYSRGMITAIVSRAEGDKETQKQLIDIYIEELKNRAPMTEGEELLERLYATWNVAPELHIEILEDGLNNIVYIGKEDVSELFFLVRDLDKQRLILDKTGSWIENPDKMLRYAASDEIKRLILEKKILTSSTYELDLYLLELDDLDPELQELGINNLDLTSDVFLDPSLTGISFRKLLINLEDKPEILQSFLKNMPKNNPDYTEIVARNLFDFEPELFSRVYFDEHFQEQTTNLDFANKYSVALTAQRYLKRSGDEVTPESIQEVTDFILEQREIFAEHVILDENTYYIPIVHEEEMFENSRMIALARDARVQNIAAEDLKGSTDITETEEVKNRFLGFVRESGDQGRTTIHFNNHGGPNHQWLTSGQVGTEVSDEMRDPRAISYVELGDALAQRGNLGEVTIMIDSCYSNDFKNYLYAYLHDNGATEMPVIITETNRGNVGWMETFIPALENSHEVGSPLTGADIYEVETETFLQQDLSVTIPLIDGELKKYIDPQTPEVIDIGSLYDEGATEAPQRVTGESAEVELPADLPSTVIEIATNEQEIEEILGLA